MLYPAELWDQPARTIGEERPAAKVENVRAQLFVCAENGEGAPRRNLDLDRAERFVGLGEEGAEGKLDVVERPFGAPNAQPGKGRELADRELRAGPRRVAERPAGHQRKDMFPSVEEPQPVEPVRHGDSQVEVGEGVIGACAAKRPDDKQVPRAPFRRHAQRSFSVRFALVARKVVTWHERVGVQRRRIDRIEIADDQVGRHAQRGRMAQAAIGGDDAPAGDRLAQGGTGADIACKQEGERSHGGVPLRLRPRGQALKWRPLTGCPIQGLRGKSQPDEPDPARTGGGMGDGRRPRLPLAPSGYHGCLMRTLLLPSLVLAILATTPLSQAFGQDAEKPVLTVYTYDSFVPDWGPGPRIETGFEAICGCDLRFVGLDDGVGILNRLRLEGEGTTADVALGMTTDLIPELRATGLFAPSGIDLSTLDLPVAYDDADFVPFDYAPLAFVYDSETVSTVPDSFDALISGPADEKIVIMDPRTSTPGLGLLLWMKAVYGDAAAEKWKALSPRILTVTPGWSEAYGLFTSGEAPIVLSYTTSPAYHMVEEGSERYKAARFSEGQYMQVEIAGILKTSDHPDLARAFLEYLVSPEVQSFIPVTNWTLPVVTPSQPLPDAFGKLVSPAKALMIDPEDVAANRQAWTQEWLQAIGR